MNNNPIVRTVKNDATSLVVRVIYSFSPVLTYLAIYVVFSVKESESV